MTLRSSSHFSIAAHRELCSGAARYHVLGWLRVALKLTPVNLHRQPATQHRRQRIQTSLSGKAAPARSTDSACAVERPERSLSTKPGSSTSGARLAFVARTRMRTAACSSPGCTGSTVAAPKAGASACKTSARPSARQIMVSVPRGRSSRAADLIQTESVPPGPAWASRRRASGEVLCRAGSLNGGFIRTRATDSGPSPAAAKARAGAATSRTTALTRALSPLSCAFSAASRASAASTSTSATSMPATRSASANPAAPTPAPRSTTRSLARAGEAAASRIASWPTRCPFFGCLSRSLPPSAASSVTSADIGTKLVSEPGILEQFACIIDAAFVDQDAARQDADRTLEHAHVLVEHDVGNVSGIEQGAHRRDQHGVVGAHKLAPPAVVLELVVGPKLAHCMPLAQPYRRSQSSPGGTACSR